MRLLEEFVIKATTVEMFGVQYFADVGRRQKGENGTLVGATRYGAVCVPGEVSTRFILACKQGPFRQQNNGRQNLPVSQRQFRFARSKSVVYA